MEYNIYLVDSFTDESFKGNPAGVVPDAKGLSEKEMQKIARELNAPETAFVIHSDSENYKIRFFTPYEEVDFCGHSALAAFYILALKGYMTALESGIKSVYILFNEKKLEVEIYFYNYEIINIVLKLGTPLEDGLISDENELLKILNLKIEDLNLEDKLEKIPIIDFSDKYAFIWVKEKEKMDKIKIDKKALKLSLEKNNIEGIHLFSLPEKNSKIIYTRSFSIINNLDESPATCSANGSLIYLLKTKGFIKANTISVIQGENIGRKSNISCYIEKKNNKYKVEVGGKGKVILEGIINVG
ncbi:MAG: PhzF family phenazine biosynthesis protein [Tissierella sp.]|uniref:PhzF family phenazine biosynthesis protein n=1 Tax=Tissierella sp. TaxID=41274 RepID=UPI003F9BF40B